MKMYEDFECCRDQSSCRCWNNRSKVSIESKSFSVEESQSKAIPQWKNQFFSRSCSDPQENALISCFLPNEYYPNESGTNHVDYMKEFHGSYDGIDSTASSKPLLFKTDPEEDVESWKNKEPKQWNNSDVLHWVASVADYYKFPYESVNANAFNIDGEKLLSMTKKEFSSVDEKFGSLLYKSLRKFCSQSQFHQQQNCKSEIKLETLSTSSNITNGLLPLSSTNATSQYGLSQDGFHNANSSESYPFELDPVTTESNSSINNNNNNNNKNNNNNNNNNTVDGSESSSSERKNSTDNSVGSDTEQSDIEIQKKVRKNGKRPPGRPPGVKSNKEKSEKKTGRLWEFIRDLLLDPQHCPSVICWENYDDGVFRFVKSEKVAKIWGDRKGNEKMNYEKLSRAMRYYYRSKVLQPVIGRRLVYKFGPTARGWKTENPNFRH